MGESAKIRQLFDLKRSMIWWVMLLLLLALVAGGISYLWSLNSESVTVNLGNERVYTVPLAIALIGAFFLGGLLVSGIALLVGLRQLFVEWRVVRKYQAVLRHRELMAQGREQYALGQYKLAATTFRRIITQAPDDIVARIMVAESLSREGDKTMALRVLDETRAEFRGNTELLLLAARINEENGNYLAARDNVQLILKLYPHAVPALRLLVRYEAKLGNTTAALDAQRGLMKLLPSAEAKKEELSLALLELKLVEEETAARGGPPFDEIKELVRRYKSFSPGEHALAGAYRAKGSVKEAAEHYLKAYTLSGEVGVLIEAVDMYLEKESPTDAIAFVRRAVDVSEAVTPNRATGFVFLVNLLLYLENIDEAETALSLIEHSPVVDKTQTLFLRARLCTKRQKGADALQSALTALSSTSPLPGDEELFFHQGAADAIAQVKYERLSY